MPGTLRLFLSLLVVFSHLGGVPDGDHFGYYAVRSFFILSGIVLTKSLHETYQFNFANFYGNRLLRIVPLYFVVCFMTIAVIAAFPDQAGDFMPRWAVKESANEVLQNFLLFPLAAGALKLRYVEPAWSLAVELVMYVLLWVGISRNKNLATLSLIFGVAYHVVMLAKGADFSERYFAMASPVFSYAIGAVVYFHYDHLAKDRRRGALAAAAWVISLVLGRMLWGDRLLDLGFYLNSVLFGLAAPFLLEIKLPGKMRAHDAILGHLSYPLFLVQWLAGFVVYLVIGGEEGRGWLIFGVALPFAVLMAALLTRLNDAFVEPLRQRLRQDLGRVQGVGLISSRRVEAAE